jgi:hypothetical protein
MYRTGDKPSGPRWRSWLVKALVTAGAIAATMAVVRSTKKRDDPDKRAAAVHDQIEVCSRYPKAVEAKHASFRSNNKGVHPVFPDTTAAAGML